MFIVLVMRRIYTAIPFLAFITISSYAVNGHREAFKLKLDLSNSTVRMRILFSMRKTRTCCHGSSCTSKNSQ